MNDFGDQPSLDDIARSDAFLDALAGGRQAAATDDTDAMLAAMLGDWRDELRWPPESELISEDAAFAAIQSGVARTGSRNPGSRNPGSRNTGRGRRHLGHPAGLLQTRFPGQLHCLHRPLIMRPILRACKR